MTILEHIQRLPENIRRQALNNTRSSYLYTLSRNRHVKSTEDALSGAFDWNKSKEGSLYWQVIYNNFNKPNAQILCNNYPCVRTGEFSR